MEIGAERQAVVAYRPVVYCLPRFMQLQQGRAACLAARLAHMNFVATNAQPRRVG